MKPLSTFDRLGFTGCSGIQRYVMARNGEGEYQGLPLDLEVEISVGEEILWLASHLVVHNLSQVLLDQVASCSDKTLSLTSPHGSQYACVASFLTAESQNILLFKGHSFSFFLVQGVTACDYWMIPSMDLLVEVTSAHVRDIDRAGTVFSELADRLKEIDEECHGKKFVFTGIIASHRRPAHFFYDCLIGMEQCFADSSSPRCQIVSHLVSLRGGDFWDLAAIYPALDSCNQLQLDEDQLNQFSRKNGLGFLKIGAWFKPQTSDLCRSLIRSLDARLKESLTNQRLGSSTVFNAVRALKQENYFIVWFGIATTKRFFSDQEHFVAQLAKRLHDGRGHVCVLIDGWTQPRSCLSSDAKFVADEQSVASRIKSRLSRCVDVVSLVGCSSMEKAAISLLTDFHITPCGTGSLWPSRFSQKPGLLHTNNTYRAKAIGSQLYALGSSLYPSEGVLPIHSLRPNELPYFMGIRNLMAWLEREFDGLFMPGPLCPSISRDGILLLANDAESYRDVWEFYATKSSRFVFILNEPRIADQSFRLFLTVDMDSPDPEDQLVVICRTSNTRVLSRRFFKVIDVAVVDNLQYKRYRLHVECSIPYQASRLVIRPRQSNGFVAFRSLRIIDSVS